MDFHQDHDHFGLGYKVQTLDIKRGITWCRLFLCFVFFTLHSNSGLVTQRRSHQIHQLNCAAIITWRLTRLENAVQPIHSLSIQEKKIICQDFSVNISLPFLWQISINSLAISKCISILWEDSFFVLKEKYIYIDIHQWKKDKFITEASLLLSTK